MTQAKDAIAVGGIFGQGMFHGALTNLAYVPEQQTDFIFSAVGEQLGFVGAGVLLLAYGVVAWRVLRTAQMARDNYGRLLCTGIFALLVFSVFENVGMNMGIMPVTGIPLPFLSYGGLGHHRVLRRHRIGRQRPQPEHAMTDPAAGQVEVPVPPEPDGSDGSDGSDAVQLQPGRAVPDTAAPDDRRRRTPLRRTGARIQAAMPVRSIRRVRQIRTIRWTWISWTSRSGPVPGPAAPMADFRMALVSSVTMDLPSQHPTVLLRELESPRRQLSFSIGLPDAVTLAHALRRIPTPRPLTHELVSGILQGFDIDVVAVRLVGRTGSIYFAELDLRGRTARSVLSARPSDALTLALLQPVPAPILIDVRLLEDAGDVPPPG